MIIKKANRKCRFCERSIEKGHRCYENTLLQKRNGGIPIQETNGNIIKRSEENEKKVDRSNGTKLQTTDRKNKRGELYLFRTLLWTRGSISEISGKPLLPLEHPQWHWQFLHVLPKGLYKRYKLNPRNIVLALPSEHEYQDKATKDPQWAWFFLLKDFLKQQYINETRRVCKAS